jgi:hypothetical protein
MSVHRITRLVFMLEGVVVSPAPDRMIKPGIAKVLDKLYQRFELWLVSSLTPEQVATIISTNSLAQWFEDDAVCLLPGHVESQEAMLLTMVETGVIMPGKSLWIDDHPIRTMLAVRRGIDASIFVDGDRLYRDLWLWGMVPLG